MAGRGLAARLAAETAGPAEYALGTAARHLAAAAQAHHARLSASPGMTGLLLAMPPATPDAAALSAAQFPDPLGLNPQPYRDRDEYQAAITQVFQARDDWRRETARTAPPGPGTAWLRDDTRPGLAEVTTRREDWDETIFVLHSMLTTQTMSPDAERILTGQLRATYQHARRLDAYSIHASQEATPYASADDVLAGLAGIETARRAWNASATATRLGEMTGRQAHGTSWHDIKLAARAAASAITSLHYPQPAPDKMATTDRDATRAAGRSRDLLLAFASTDYASSADRDLLVAVIKAVHRHAARIHATVATGLGADIGAGLAALPAVPRTPEPARTAPAQEPAPAAPAPSTATGLVIEHTPQGTLLHGTRKDDADLRVLLHQQGFRWSRNLNAWYLPRNWTWQTRDLKVTTLTRRLQQASRPFTVRSDPAQPSPDEQPLEPLPAADPYTSPAQAQTDLRRATSAYWKLKDTPAGRTVMNRHGAGARPDSQALDAAYRDATDRSDPFDGDPQEVTDRMTTWADAARVLARNLSDERHRAPKFRDSLGTFITAAATLASRTRATAQDPGTWARIFPRARPAAPEPAPASSQKAAEDAAPRPGSLPAQPRTTAGAGEARTAQPHTGTSPDAELGTVPPAGSQLPTASEQPGTTPPEPAAPGRDVPDGTRRPGDRAPRPVSAAETATGTPTGPDATGTRPAPPPQATGPADDSDAVPRPRSGPSPAAERPETPPARQPAGDEQPPSHPAAPAPPEEAASPPAPDGPPPGTRPVTNGDLAAVLPRYGRFTDWVRDPRGHHPSPGTTQDAWPGQSPSARWDDTGLEITAAAPAGPRHGLVTWEQAASWIGNGMTPARRGIMLIAASLCDYIHDQPARAKDPDGILDALLDEAAQIRDDAVTAITKASLSSRGAAKPVPPAADGEPAWYAQPVCSRPDRSASRQENAALARLTELRTLLRDPQPATPAQIKAMMRQHYDLKLPELIGALGNPAAMRAWIDSQAARQHSGQYDTSGECWYGSSPDGLIMDRRGDSRAPVLIRWDEIPAWIQPAITPGLKHQIAQAHHRSTALTRQWLTAAVHPAATAPSGQAEEQATQQHHEATTAAWAAIDAAPPPAPADLEHSRHFYRDTSPVQDSLFTQDTTPDRPQAAARQQEPRPAPAPGPDPRSTQPGAQPPGAADAPATTQAQKAAAPAARKPQAARVRWMNESDIEEAVQRWKHHPVLGPATKTLNSLKDWANATSDGWAHWPAPSRAATALMTLIERDGTYKYIADTERADATPAELKAAYRPLKAFRTKRNAGFTIEEPAAPARTRTGTSAPAARQAPAATPPASAAGPAPQPPDRPASPPENGSVKPGSPVSESPRPPQPAPAAGSSPAAARAPAAGNRDSEPAGPQPEETRSGDPGDPVTRWGLVDAGTFTRTAECQLTIMETRSSCGHAEGTCQCVGTGDLYRSACRGQDCGWKGQVRDQWNDAVEDGHDHVFPGWRDLPVVAASPRYYPDKRAWTKWKKEVTRLYPPGWLERGGPVRTYRTPPMNRDHPMTLSGWTGWDISVPPPAQPEPETAPAPAARKRPAPAPAAAGRQSRTGTTRPESAAEKAGSTARPATSPAPGPAATTGTAAPASAQLQAGDLAAVLHRIPGLASWLASPRFPPPAVKPRLITPFMSGAWDEDGITITVTQDGASRHGTVTWGQAAAWIGAAATPARRGIALMAARLHAAYNAQHYQLQADGYQEAEGSSTRVTLDELTEILDTAITAITGTALRVSGPASPIPAAPDSDPPWCTAPLITRPGPGVSPAGNTVLERLTELRDGLDGEPQEVTSAEIRAAIRARTRADFADLVAALDDPAAMRAWLSTRTGTAAGGDYDPPDGPWWYGTDQHGLIIDRRGDHRPPFALSWSEVPAWIAPGLTENLREEVISSAAAAEDAITRRYTTEPRTPAPGEDEFVQAMTRAEKARDAAWDAITAAPPPGYRDLRHAADIHHRAIRPAPDQASAPAAAPATPEPGPAQAIPGINQPAPRRQPGAVPAASRPDPQPAPAAPAAASPAAAQPASPPGAPAGPDQPPAALDTSQPEPVTKEEPMATATSDPPPAGTAHTVQSGTPPAPPQAAPASPGPDRPHREPDGLAAVLDAISERTSNGTEEFGDIRAAFTTLATALASPAAPALPGPASHDSLQPDIAAVLADWYALVTPPPQGGRTGTGSGDPLLRMLDRAADEARACARWYDSTPEWHRTTRVTRAAADLLTAIRSAAGEWWNEVRQDSRLRGFARATGARLSRTVASAAQAIAYRLDNGGYGATRAWRAVTGLHQSAARLADRLIRYTPPPDITARTGQARQPTSNQTRPPGTTPQPADPEGT
jgi:hypothetical protein